jgi:putative exosortase-associated protein (TIGR04073 family)
MTGRSIISIFMIFSFVTLAAAFTAFADEIRPIEDYSAQEVVSGMAGKTGRGIANVATGWLEFPKQIYLTVNEDGTTKGILLGPLKGIGMAVARTVAGAVEIATFFVPCPGFYDPLLEPPYIWQKE